MKTTTCVAVFLSLAVTSVLTGTPMPPTIPEDPASVTRVGMVCLFPSSLEVIGNTHPATASCIPGGDADLVSWPQYWRQAFSATIFHNQRQEKRYARVVKRWLRDLRRGRGSARGERLLELIYDDATQGDVGSQTDALFLLSRLTHFATQLGESGPWPALFSSVSYAQLDWLSEPGIVSIPNTHVLEATFHIGVLDAQVLAEQGGAFADLVVRALLPARVPIPVTPEDWRVRNLYLNFATAAEVALVDPAVWIGMDTPDGERIPEVEFLFVLDGEPGTFADLQVDPSTIFNAEGVELEGFLLGGVKDEDDLNGTDFFVPDDVEVWDGCPMVDTAPETCLPTKVSPPPPPTVVTPPSLPAVSEGDNQCVPGAVARALNVLLGGAAGHPQITHLELIQDMHTNGQGTGSYIAGTYISDMISGKNAYVARHGLSVTTTRANGSDFLSNVAAAMATLDVGGVVEVHVNWGSGGGHVAYVKSMVQKADGSIEIVYVDDASQGDGRANADVHTISVDSSGNFTAPVGTVAGFILETSP